MLEDDGSLDGTILEGDRLLDGAMLDGTMLEGDGLLDGDGLLHSSDCILEGDDVTEGNDVDVEIRKVDCFLFDSLSTAKDKAPFLCTFSRSLLLTLLNKIMFHFYLSFVYNSH